jgi:hypothetical protein
VGGCAAQRKSVGAGFGGYAAETSTNIFTSMYRFLEGLDGQAVQSFQKAVK